MLGTSKESQQAQPPPDAAELGAITLRDRDGNDVRLRDLWSERPAVLVWLRHYG